MTSLYIVLGLAGIALFIFIGYLLWNTAYENYNHNIFGIGTIVRGLLSLGCLFMAGVFADQSADFMDSIVWLILFLILWIWTFVATWKNTNLLIAFFSLLYQLFAVIMIKAAIDRLLRD